MKSAMRQFLICTQFAAGLFLFAWLLPGRCYADNNLNHPGYELTWHDNFYGTNVNTANWNVITASNNANSQLQDYEPWDVYVTNGMLVLESDEVVSGGQTNYTSGEVTSAGLFNQLYGWFEWNGQIPEGQGLWPAYWMLNYVTWPPEIDVMETIGTEVDCNTMSLHWGPLPPGCIYPWDCGHTENTEYCGTDFASGFNTFAVDWEPWGARFYINGVIQYYAGNLGNCTNTMYLIMDTAVGGTWPGSPDSTTPFPSYNYIQYVHMYQPIFGQYTLLNPGFESGATVYDFDNWNVYDSGNVQRDPVPSNSRSGSKCVQMWGRYTGENNTSGMYQDLWARPGDQWQSSIWGRNRPGDLPQGGNQGRLKLEFVDQFGNVLISNVQTNLTSSSSTNYTRFTIADTAPSGTARARIVMEYFQTNNGNGSVDFDDARLDLLWRLPNILGNPNFANFLDGWTGYGTNSYYVNTDPGIAMGGGSNYFKVYGQFNGSQNFSGCYQDNTSSAGTVYTADGYGYTLGVDEISGDNSAWIEVTFRDVSTNILALYRSAYFTADTVTNEWIDLPVTNQYDPNTYAWIQSVTKLVAPAGTAFVRYQITFSQPPDNPAGSVYFDNLRLTSVAAPVPPGISTPLPDGTIPFAACTNTFCFTVSSPGIVNTNSIQLLLNGLNVSSQLVFIGSPTSWNIAFPGLALNHLYTATIIATNAGGSVSNTVAFDTFNMNNFTIEAEDFDFSGGQFIDNPVPSSTSVTNGYFDRDGIYSLDEYFVSYLGTHVYRPADHIATEVTTDFTRQKFFVATQTDPNAHDYDVGWWVSGAWVNYTRTIPTNNYNIYARLAGNNNVSYTVALGRVTAGVGTSSQTVQPLGNFQSVGLGYTNWNWVPLTSTNGGSPLMVSLGGVTTLRATTSGDVNANFYMLVPAPTPPVITASTTATGVQISVPTQAGFNYDILYTDDLTGNNWQLLGILSGDGTIQSITEPVVGTSQFYEVLVQ
jgi:beta-glucanase (GH16 family)